MKNKEELTALNALFDEKLDGVSGGTDCVENESDIQLSRHNIRSPLTGADAPCRAELEAASAGYDPEQHRIEPPTVREVLFRSGMTQAQLARRFDIPKRTVENWCMGVRKLQEYVVKMMIEILFGYAKS